MTETPDLTGKNHSETVAIMPWWRNRLNGFAFALALSA
jgi:hypothetical protein